VVLRIGFAGGGSPLFRARNRSAEDPASRRRNTRRGERLRSAAEVVIWILQKPLAVADRHGAAHTDGVVPQCESVLIQRNRGGIHVSQRVLLQLWRRNRHDARCRQRITQRLKIREEEQLVLLDRAADRTTKLVGVRAATLGVA